MGLSDQVVELCADADVVLQLTMKEPTANLSLMMPVASDASSAGGGSGVGSSGSGSSAPVAPSPHAQRVFLTQPDNKWFRKVRGFGVEREEVLDLSQGKGLRELLLRAGFRM